MQLNELGFDYSTLEFASISKKNHLLLLIMLIFSSSFFIILITFIILYLLKVPMDINGVQREFSEPEYSSFFTMFLTILTALSLLGIIIAIIQIFIKPKPYINLNKDIDLNKYYQIIINNSKEFYLFDQIGFYYFPKTQEVTKIKNYSEIINLKEKYIFWERFNKVENPKIKILPKKIVLSFKQKNQRTILQYRYSFKNINGIYPEIVSEAIQNGSGTRNSLNQMATYYFDSINRQPNTRLPDKIITILQENY